MAMHPDVDGRLGSRVLILLIAGFESEAVNDDNMG